MRTEQYPPHAVAILELADPGFDPDVAFQASEYIDRGLTVFDAFHGALAGDRIISSDEAYDGTGVERVELEESGA